MISVARHGGRPCDDPSINRMEDVCSTKPCAIDCLYQEWSQWTGCDKSCGVGAQMRSRDHIKTSEYTGTPCSMTNSVTQQCHQAPCPVDCVLADWVEWATCTEDCGGGSKARHRELKSWAEHGGVPCGHLGEMISCNEWACDDPLPAGEEESGGVLR